MLFIVHCMFNSYLPIEDERFFNVGGDVTVLLRATSIVTWLKYLFTVMIYRETRLLTFVYILRWLSVIQRIISVIKPIYKYEHMALSLHAIGIVFHTYSAMLVYRMHMWLHRLIDYSSNTYYLWTSPTYVYYWRSLIISYLFF